MLKTIGISLSKKSVIGYLLWVFCYEFPEMAIGFILQVKIK